ncbi:sugar ABC transporter ATP-binding protein [Lichenicoccus roseus]|uniref:Sugar ABC transporter ATP-binding protein n=1 Tax=Lichenicoccus roseus TaxID=2683649 RepID=A0A5R9J9K5_9PROT|nr:sugar ABC transporter ATP-binding protein [Lichenicoccus roseus]TLU74280.1 sugar ABC transporter ATP-binding protein [Lichenicoccus roseus]
MQPILSLDGVAKSYGGVKALTSGALDLYCGQVTALLGENGAGKSTLVKIITGIVHADGGTITLDGKPVVIESAEHARSLGISAIFQEPVVFDALTVAENIFITGRPLKGRSVDWPTMMRRSREILAELDPSIDPAMVLGRLSVAQRHLVQIARALSNDARIVIMDEPTAALSHREAEELFAITRRLRDEGRAILFISHKFEEVFALCDRYAVFRDGAGVGQGTLQGMSSERLITLMVGRPVDQVFPKQVVAIGEEVLRVEALGRCLEYENVSFDVRRGEILGVYGLIGAGRSEVMHALFGTAPAETGRIVLNGETVSIRSAQQAIAHGIGLVPEDRQRQGAHLRLAIGDNITLPSLGRTTRGGFLSARREREQAAPLAEQLGVKMSGLRQRVEDLSGGNQQKVVIAKWLATAPRVLILDEPTKGIDVGAKAQVHRLMGELAAKGVAIIMVSSELPEVLGMADRIMVMRRGLVQGIVPRSEATPERIVKMATDA